MYTPFNKYIPRKFFYISAHSDFWNLTNFIVNELLKTRLRTKDCQIFP